MKKSLKLMVLCMMIFWATESLAETPADGNSKAIRNEMKTAKLEEINKGILYLLRSSPVHPVVQSPDLRLKVAVAIYKAAEKTKYDWNVLASMIYSESSFNSEAEGPIGEVGLMQLHTERPWRHCEFKEQREVNRDDLNDQILCGAYWLRFGQEKVCNGSLAQGISKFMTAGTCVPEPETKLARKVKRRLRIMKTLKSDKVQVDFMETWEQNKKRRAEYIAERKAKRQAKLQAKWNRRWKRQQAAKKARRAALQAKWDENWKNQQSRQEEKGIIFSVSKSETKYRPKG